MYKFMMQDEWVLLVHVFVILWLVVSVNIVYCVQLVLMSIVIVLFEMYC